MLSALIRKLENRTEAERHRRQRDVIDSIIAQLRANRQAVEVIDQTEFQSPVDVDLAIRQAMPSCRTRATLIGTSILGRRSWRMEFNA